VLLVLLVMPVALLLMLMALERYERLIGSEPRPDQEHDPVGAQIPALDVAPQVVPERAPGFATEVA
jgi:hypothetical protein